jgi:F-type H+-transporting ATPase subunit gamma
LRNRSRTEPRTGCARGQIEITGEHVGVLGKVEFAQARALAENVIERYEREEIDSVYVVFNEFKSVIAQRLIVEQILPIEQIGAAGRSAQGRDDGRRKEKGERSRDQRRRGLAFSGDTRGRPAARQKIGTAQVDYIYEQPPEELFRSLLPKYVASRFSARCWSRWRRSMPRA